MKVDTDPAQANEAARATASATPVTRPRIQVSPLRAIAARSSPTNVFKTGPPCRTGPPPGLVPPLGPLPSGDPRE